MVDVTLYENSTGLVDFLGATNTIVGGMYGDVILLILWLIMFFILKKFETKQAFATASFTAALISVFMFTIGLVQERSMIIAIIFAAFSIIWLRWTDT